MKRVKIINLDAARDVRIACRAFLNREIGAQKLQGAIYSSEQRMEALEDKWIREILFSAENEIEAILYARGLDEPLQEIDKLAKYIIESVMDEE